MSLLSNNLGKYMKSNHAKMIASANKETLESLYSVLLINKSHQVSECFINYMIRTLYNVSYVPELVSINENEYMMENKYMFQINLSCWDQLVFLKTICCQQNHLLKKQFIVVNITSHLKNNVLLALTSILNKYIANCLIIIKNNKGFHMPIHLINSCISVNLTIDHDIFLKDFSESINISTNAIAHLKDVRDPLDMCMIAEYPDFDYNYIQPFLDHYFKLLKLNSNKTLEKYGKILREFCNKISASSIPIDKIAKEIIVYLKNPSAEVVNILAEMESMSKKTTKYMFLLEYSIDRVCQLIK
jgi:hypothetical protein